MDIGPDRNRAESKRLLIHVLKLKRERGDDHGVARTLRVLSDANQLIGLPREGIRRAKEGLEIFERLGNTVGQGLCLIGLTQSLCDDRQLDAAEEAASRAINLFIEVDYRYLVCRSHRILGNIYLSKGERETVIDHFEEALRISSPFDWREELSRVHFALGTLFSDDGRLYDAHVHAE